MKGRTQALKIYELLALSKQLAPSHQAFIANYAKGLAHWRTGEFDLASSYFKRSAEVDRPSSIFLERAREFAKKVPGPEWDPVRTLQEK